MNSDYNITDGEIMTESNIKRAGGAKAPLILFACVGLAVLLLVIFASYDPRDSQRLMAEQMPGVGQPLTLLHLDPLAGDAKPLDLKDLQGKVALINYWGTWCGPCRIEMPHLIELNKRWREDEHFLFVSVSCGGYADNEQIPDLRKETEEFLKEEGYDLAVHADAKGESRHALGDIIQQQQEGFNYPTTVLLDQKGIIRCLWVGYAPGAEAEMHLAVEKLLGKGTKGT